MLLPSRLCEFQKMKRFQPMLIDFGRHDAFEIVGLEAGNRQIVEQARELIGKCDRSRRRRRDALAHFCVFQHELGERQSPLRRVDRREQAALVGESRECELVLVHLAERDDIGKESGAYAEFFEEGVLQRAHRTLGRQVDRGRRECERIFARLETGHELAVEESVHQRRQKRCRSRDGENARLAHGSDRAAAHGLFGGSDRLGRAHMHPGAFEREAMRRPSASARSNSRGSENAPAGAPANKRGESTAAPA